VKQQWIDWVLRIVVRSESFVTHTFQELFQVFLNIFVGNSVCLFHFSVYNFAFTRNQDGLHWCSSNFLFLTEKTMFGFFINDTKPPTFWRAASFYILVACMVCVNWLEETSCFLWNESIVEKRIIPGLHRSKDLSDRTHRTRVSCVISGTSRGNKEKSSDLVWFFHMFIQPGGHGRCTHGRNEGCTIPRAPNH